MTIAEIILKEIVDGNKKRTHRILNQCIEVLAQKKNFGTTKLQSGLITLELKREAKLQICKIVE